MKFLKFLAGTALALLLLFAAVVGMARLGDGPTGLLPGGAFKTGALHTGPEPDWSFARDLPVIEFQLVTPPVSRTIWLQVVDGKLYAVSGYMNTTVGKFWKKWPMQAAKDPRAIVRVGGTRYPRRLQRLAPDDPVLADISAEVKRKYGVPLTPESAATGDAWFYLFAPPKAALPA